MGNLLNLTQLLIGSRQMELASDPMANGSENWSLSRFVDTGGPNNQVNEICFFILGTPAYFLAPFLLLYLIDFIPFRRGLYKPDQL